MDQQGTPPDDLDVRLRWPGESPGSDVSHSDPRPEDATTRIRSTPSSAQPVAAPDPPDDVPPMPGRGLDVQMIAARTDSMQAALASIAVRLDGLTNGMSLLRTVLSERLTDFGEQVIRMQTSNDRELGDYRRLHERSLTEIESGLGAGEQALYRLERSMTAMVTDLDKVALGLQSQLQQLAQLEQRVDDVASETAQRLQPDLSPLQGELHRLHSQLEVLSQRTAAPEVDLSPVHGGLEYLQTQLKALMDRPEVPPVDLAPVFGRLQHLDDLLTALADRAESPQVELGPVYDQLQHLDDQLASLKGLEGLLQEVRAGIEALRSRPDTEASALHAATVTTAIERLELAVATLSAAPRTAEDLTAKAINELSERLGRLAFAQSEDLERLLHAVEEVGGGPSSAGDKLPSDGPDLGALITDIEASGAAQTKSINALRSTVDAQRKASTELAAAIVELSAQLTARFDGLEEVATATGRGDAGSAEILERLDVLANHTEILRKRIALRARSEPVLDPATIEVIAETVVRRLSADQSSDAESGSAARRRGRRA